MTIPAGESSVSRHTGNGVADTFDYEFKITAEADLKVTVTDDLGNDTVLTLTTDYTVTGVGNDAGGSITLTAGALASGYLIAIEDNVEVSQLTPYGNQSAFFGSLHEDSFDKNMRIARKAISRSDRSLKIPVTVGGVSTELPAPVALNLVRWTAGADALENVSPEDIATTVAFSNWNTDTFTDGVDFTAGTTTQITLSKAPGVIANTQVYFDGVYQEKSGYTLATDIITFTTAIPVGVTNVEVTYGTAAEVEGAASSREVQTGDGVKTAFTTGVTYTPGIGDLHVYLNGIRMSPVYDYTETSANIVTFNVAPSNGDLVLFMTNAFTNAVTIDSSNVSYTPAGTGAVATNVQAKLRESVSVTDFGAVGDGVTDDTAAIQAALASLTSGGVVLFPNGTYKVTDALEALANTIVELDGSTIQFVITGDTDCFNLNTGCTIRNGAIDLAGSSYTGSGDNGCPIIIGNYATGTSQGIHNVLVENMTITSNKSNGNGVMVTNDSHDIVIRNIDFPDSAYLMQNVIVHWGGADGDVTDGTFHPHNITIENIKMGTMSYASAVDSAHVFLSGCYNISVKNVEIESAHNAGLYIYCGDYGFNYAPSAVQPFANQNILVENFVVRTTDKYGAYVRGDTIGGTTTQYEIPAVIKNFSAKGANTAEEHGIYFHKSGGSFLEKCTLTNFDCGIFATSISGVYSSNVTIKNCTTYNNTVDAGSHGINLQDGTSGHRVQDCLSYGNSGSGIYSDADDSIIDGCYLGEASDTQPFGIRVASNASNMTITNNYCREAATAGFSNASSTTYGVLRLFQNNNCHGDVALPYGGVTPTPFVLMSSGTAQRQMLTGTAAPTSGTWAQGDMVFDVTPSASSFIGWVCTAGGSPGTWKTFGAISA